MDMSLIDHPLIFFTDEMSVNLVFEHIVSSENNRQLITSSTNVFQHFDKNQMKQLMAMFVQHLSASDKKNTPHDGMNDHPYMSIHLCSKCVEFFFILDC